MRELAVMLLCAGCLDDPVPLQPGMCLGAVAGTAVVNISGDASKGLTLNTSPGRGVWESEPFTFGAPFAFSRLQWHPRGPYGRALPEVQDPPFDEGRITMSNLIFLAHLDETTGTVFHDATGTNDLQCPVSCPMPSPARFAGGLSFQGDGAYVTAPRLDDSLEPAHLTLEAWAMPTGAPLNGDTTSMIVAKGHGDNSHLTSYSLEWDPTNGGVGRCYAGVGLSGSLRGTRSLPQNQWFHMACTWDGTTLRLYTNGSLDNMIKPPSPSPAIDYSGTLDDELFIGRWGRGTQRMVGLVDEVAIYSEALDEATISAHYLRGALRLGLQVRSCDRTPCTGPWVGPDGSDATSFAESCAPDESSGDRSLPLAGYDCRDGTHAGGGALPSPVSWVQYRLTLDSDVAGGAPAVSDVRFCR